MASVWLRLLDVTVAEPPRTPTGFLHHERSAAYGRIAAVTHPVYVVRHGQSEWNVRRLTQGQTAHPPLTAVGRSQSSAAAGLIAADIGALGLAADRLISSDLTRAIETAEVIGHRLELTVESDPRLRERHLGELEGRSYEETWAAAESFDWSDPTQPIAGGESLMDVYERMAAVLPSWTEGLTGRRRLGFFRWPR
jgi:probable phosphoglycerate mutase